MTKFSNPQLKIFLLPVFTFLFFIFAFGKVFAAEISFDSKIKEIEVGSQFEAGIFLNTRNEDINAVEGKLFFPDELLEIKEIKDGNSIINFWAKRPQSNSPGEIIFSGITPGGYNGEKGLLFSIIFQTKKIGEGSIEFYDLKALKNDGLGTPAEITISSFRFLISGQLPTSQGPTFQAPITQAKDNEPPETFQPEIGRDETMLENRWFIVFAAQDKGSGIDHYEVLESKNQKTENRSWEIAESPYVLEDQELRSYIYVKAIDKAGNERIAVLAPKYPLKWYEIYWWWSIIIGITGLIIAYIIWRIKKPKEKF